MSDDVYERLHERIDQYSVGFSKSPTGLELKILKHLFTPAEAAFYLHLTRTLEPAAAIAARAGVPEAEAAAMLAVMNEKGLLFPATREGVKYYAAAPFMHGFYEHAAVKGLDPELAKLVHEYVTTAFIPKSRTLRTVPVNVTTVPGGGDVLPYDDVRAIIMGKERIGIIDCACAAEKRATGHDCKRPSGVCMAFDFYAEYPIEEFGRGRWITREEALKILDEAEEAGLVHQVGGDRRNVECICNCCPECCTSLSMLRAFGKPGLIAGNNYRAAVSEACIACEACLERCPMGALAMTGAEGRAAVDPEKCIGCGLCIRACAVEAITLAKKPEDEIRRPPSPERYTFMRSSLDYYEDLKKKG